MSLRFIIDGYNLIWSPASLKTSYAGQAREGSLQAQRERLLKFLEETKPAGKNKMTVVFDGKENVDSPPWKGTVQVMFSRGGDADGLIKQLIDDMKNASNAVVVSDDKSIQKWVRAAKAKTLSCADFLTMGYRGGPSKSGPSSKPSPDQAIRMNEEFKRIWKIP